jgi:hypothetical protein
MLQSVGALSSGSRIARLGTSSKSSGFLKTGKVSSKKNKKYRKRTRFVLNGTTTIYETGGTQASAASGEIVYVGHSFPIRTMKECVWWTVLRQLAIKAGFRVGQFEPATTWIAIGANADDSILYRYKATADGAVIATTFVLAANTISQTIEELSKDLQTGNAEGVLWLDMYYQPKVTVTTAVSNANLVCLKLDSCKIKLDMKGDLKIQNRTVNVSTITNEDDVNNSPIYGKSYEGMGSGPYIKGNNVGSTSAFSFIANNVTGVIAVSPTQDHFKEPLDYQMFQPVKKIGKIHLDPGQIKTSVISKRISMDLNRFFLLISPVNTDTATATSQGLGQRRVDGTLANYRMFAVEKLLDANISTLTTPVTVAYEHNLKIMCSVSFRNSNPTNLRFIKTRANG